MKYVVDHDIHIHSGLSLCSGDERQNPESILAYAKETGLSTVCLTDHFWDYPNVPTDNGWYTAQNYPHIAENLPLPQDPDVRFLFGCETEMDCSLTVGIAKETLDRFDFIIVPTTHLHMGPFVAADEDLATPERRARMWEKRFAALLDKDFPFHKMGIAHLCCDLIAPDEDLYYETLRSLSESRMNELFTAAAKVGIGIELNAGDLRRVTDQTEDLMLLPFRIAKECGCKFYFGSDAHSPEDFVGVKSLFERAVERLGLEETDKFTV